MRKIVDWLACSIESFISGSFLETKVFHQLMRELPTSWQKLMDIGLSMEGV